MLTAEADISSDASLAVDSIANPTVLDPAWRTFTREATVTNFVRPANVNFVRPVTGVVIEFIRPADIVFRRVA